MVINKNVKREIQEGDKLGCSVTQLCPTLLWPHGLLPASFLCSWDFPGKNTGVGCHFLLQEIFPTQGSNLGLPYCRQTLYHLSHQGLRVVFKPWGKVLLRKFNLTLSCHWRNQALAALVVPCTDLMGHCIPFSQEITNIKVQILSKVSAHRQLSQVHPTPAQQ